jgi:hypothetical protein
VCRAAPHGAAELQPADFSAGDGERIRSSPQVERRGADIYDGARIARLIGFVEGRRASMGIEPCGSQQEYDRALAVLRDGIGGDRLADLMAAGATMSEDEVIEKARALE